VLTHELLQAKKTAASDATKDAPLPEELKDCDAELVRKIESDIGCGEKVAFQDIAGLESAKRCVQELICWCTRSCQRSQIH
jgi:hypothetical protein